MGTTSQGENGEVCISLASCCRNSKERESAGEGCAQRFNKGRKRNKQTNVERSEDM